MDFKKICINCMKEKESADGPCPYCGYDSAGYQPKPFQLPPMTILSGKYLIGRVIGQGGFGIVYTALEMNLNIMVAIKELYPTNLVTRSVSMEPNSTNLTGFGDKQYLQEIKDKFIREAQTIAHIQERKGEEGIVRVRDLFEENETAYIVMDFLYGETLKQYLKEHGPIECDTLLRMLRPCMTALKNINDEGIIHRDVSPDNIMVTDDSDGEDGIPSLKLIDFGNIKQKNPNGENHKSTIVTIKKGYTPMEQYSTNGNIGPWTDVYAMCATIYNCMTGQLLPEPMEMAESGFKMPSELGFNVPKEVEDVLKEGLSVKYSTRIQNFHELIEKLYHEEEGVTVGGRSGIHVASLPGNPSVSMAGRSRSFASRSASHAARSTSYPSSQVSHASRASVSQSSAGRSFAQPGSVPQQSQPVYEEPAAVNVRPKSGKGKKIAITAAAVLAVVVTAGLIVRQRVVLPEEDHIQSEEVGSAASVSVSSQQDAASETRTPEAAVPETVATLPEETSVQIASETADTSQEAELKAKAKAEEEKRKAAEKEESEKLSESESAAQSESKAESESESSVQSESQAASEKAESESNAQSESTAASEKAESESNAQSESTAASEKAESESTAQSESQAASEQQSEQESQAASEKAQTETMSQSEAESQAQSETESEHAAILASQPDEYAAAIASGNYDPVVDFLYKNDFDNVDNGVHYYQNGSEVDGPEEVKDGTATIYSENWLYTGQVVNAERSGYGVMVGIDSTWDEPTREKRAYRVIDGIWDGDKLISCTYTDYYQTNPDSWQSNSGPVEDWKFNGTVTVVTPKYSKVNEGQFLYDAVLTYQADHGHAEILEETEKDGSQVYVYAIEENSQAEDPMRLYKPTTDELDKMGPGDCWEKGSKN